MDCLGHAFRNSFNFMFTNTFLGGLLAQFNVNLGGFYQYNNPFNYSNSIWSGFNPFMPNYYPATFDFSKMYQSTFDYSKISQPTIDYSSIWNTTPVDKIYSPIFTTKPNNGYSISDNLMDFYEDLGFTRSSSTSSTSTSTTSTSSSASSSTGAGKKTRTRSTQVTSSTSTATEGTRRTTTSTSTKNDKTFEQMLDFVLQAEGGYNPNDSGQAGNKGIQQSTYDSYRKRKGLEKKDVKYITNQEVYDIYYNDYYKASGADKISDKRLALYVFDTAVNMGVGRAKELLELSGHDADKFESLRRNKYEEIAAKNPDKAKYLRGWLNRMDNLVAHADKNYA